MSFRIRAANTDDLDALYELSKMTGGGFTNLPPDRDTLAEKLERSAAGYAREGEHPDGDLYVFVLEDMDSGRIRGTCQVFGKVGVIQPFYSYRISTLSQQSQELGRTFRNRLLTLVTDLEGESEVGGLFLHPSERAGGLGMLLARSRYLFIKQHRPRFGDKVLAELRGVIDPAGNSAFWDALAGRFFGMTFPEADDFNAMHGTQFIADLMPKTPIYVNMLPDAARSVIGQPHPTGRAAMKMLEREGFEWDSYIDIFDGGPTVLCSTDRIKTVRDSEWHQLSGAFEGDDGEELLVAAGRLDDFVSCYATGKVGSDGIAIDRKAIDMLDLEEGDRLLAVARR